MTPDDNDALAGLAQQLFGTPHKPDENTTADTEGSTADNGDDQ